MHRCPDAVGQDRFPGDGLGTLAESQSVVRVCGGGISMRRCRSILCRLAGLDEASQSTSWRNKKLSGDDEGKRSIPTSVGRFLSFLFPVLVIHVAMTS